MSINTKEKGNMTTEIYLDAQQIIQTLAKDGTFLILSAIQKEPERAYLNQLEVLLKKHVSRATIHARLKELESFGIITAIPYLEPSEKKLVLRYRISKKGNDILRTIERLHLPGEGVQHRSLVAAT